MTVSSKAWRWIVRPVCALLILLVTLEAGLQIAARLLKDESRAGIARFVTQRQRVLFLGDSNTYGLYVEHSQAYPAVFERAWNERYADRPIEVVNLAYPGTNSSRILRELPHILRSFRPDTIVLMVGSNDYWTTPVAPAEASSFAMRAGEWLWDWSRVYRLLFMLRRTVAARSELSIEANERGNEAMLRYGGDSIVLGFEGRPAYAAFQTPMISDALVANLNAISKSTREAGVRLLLLTYPAERRFYGPANKQIRRVAEEASIPLVDLAARFRPERKTGSCDLLFGDLHPTVSGHALAAEHLLETLGPHGL